MMLTVGNTKGGVGKTTLAVQIALTWAIAGRCLRGRCADRPSRQPIARPVTRAIVSSASAISCRSPADRCDRSKTSAVSLSPCG